LCRSSTITNTDLPRTVKVASGEPLKLFDSAVVWIQVLPSRLPFPVESMVTVRSAKG
jgi:hypothetical protein